jgi:uncharacterized protein YecE (DUF72 family)
MSEWKVPKPIAQLNDPLSVVSAQCQRSPTCVTQIAGRKVRFARLSHGRTKTDTSFNPRSSIRYNGLMAVAIKIGVAGWSYKDWAGVVYPGSLKAAQRLGYLAEFFNLVEINTSFYGAIRPEVGREWCRIVAGRNPDFTFTAKLYRGFTHSPIAVVESTSASTIRPAAGDERDVKAGFDAIASQGLLGAVLAQFPISFKCTDQNRVYLEQLAARFGEYPLVLEVRHASWNRPETLIWLAALGVGLCNIDQPLLGRAIRPAAKATSTIGYVRLHGRNYKQWFGETNVRDRYDYLYSGNELKQWKERVTEVSEQTATTYVVANNHNLGKAAVNALELMNLLDQKKVKTPPTLLAAYPEQLGAIAREQAKATTSPGTNESQMR